MHPDRSIVGRLTRGAYTPQQWLWTLLALLVTRPLAAQDDGQPAGGEHAGFRLVYGATLVRPFLDKRAHAPFDSIGEFRAGPGIQIGAGYEMRRWEVTATADLAGLDVGEPVEHDEVPMGREASILWALGVHLWWSPPGREIGRWRPRIGGGYARSGLGKVKVRPDQLPPAIRDVAQIVVGVDQGQAAGIVGSGIRLGMGAERDFARSLALRLDLTADYLQYRKFVYGAGEFAWGGGAGWVPRLSAALRWVP